jgi:hypothetical protein
MRVAVAMVGVGPRLSEREAEAFPFAIQRRIETAILFVSSDRVEDRILVHPCHRGSRLYQDSPRLVLKELDRDRCLGACDPGFAVLSRGSSGRLSVVALLMRQRGQARQENHRRQQSKSHPMTFHVATSVLVVSQTDHDPHVLIYGGDCAFGLREKKSFLVKNFFNGPKSKTARRSY